jgi:hypothetical protein
VGWRRRVVILALVLLDIVFLDVIIHLDKRRSGFRAALVFRVVVILNYTILLPLACFGGVGSSSRHRWCTWSSAGGCRYAASTSTGL